MAAAPSHGVRVATGTIGTIGTTGTTGSTATALDKTDDRGFSGEDPGVNLRDVQIQSAISYDGDGEVPVLFRSNSRFGSEESEGRTGQVEEEGRGWPNDQLPRRSAGAQQQGQGRRQGVRQAHPSQMAGVAAIESASFVDPQQFECRRIEITLPDQLPGVGGKTFGHTFTRRKRQQSLKKMPVKSSKDRKCIVM